MMTGMLRPNYEAQPFKIVVDPTADENATSPSR
jgi:hypothetical protein